jgi:predicted DsbA family dithiol-disulfide isomerase
VQIDVWSDFACPWCALGLVRLDAALDLFEHGAEVRVQHRSFELHPGAPASSDRQMDEAVAAKYGISRERARAGHERLAELGRAEGFTFDFERVRLGSTFDAHRLAQAARGTAAEPGLLRALYRARFSEGRQLADGAVLRQVAAEAGLGERLAEAALRDEAYADAVRRDEEAALDLDVMGVPHFLLNGAWPIPGAQDTETFLIVLRRAWERSAH